MTEMLDTTNDSSNSSASFSIGTKELRKVVSQLSPMFKGGFDSNPRVLFKVADKVTAYATNGDSYTEVSFDCNIEKKGEIAVSGEKFEDIIKGVLGDEIKMVIDKNSLVIDSKNIKYRIALVDSNVDYLEAPEIKDANSFFINAQEFKSAILAVSCCIDQAKAHLNCIMMHSNEGDNSKLFVVATDGMRLGVAERKVALKSQVPNLMIPKKSAEYIASMIGEIQGDVEVKYTDNMIQVCVSGILYTSKLLDTNFPKYQSVIPVNNNKIFEIDNALLNSTIKSMKTVNESNMRINLALSSNSLNISCIDNNGDESNTTLPATYSDKEELKIACNFRLLCEILDKITSSIVRMQFTDATTPILIRSVDDETIKYVFMPFVS